MGCIKSAVYVNWEESKYQEYGQAKEVQLESNLIEFREEAKKLPLVVLHLNS